MYIIRFRIFRVVIWTNWNNYYNITNVPTTLHLNQIKRILGSHQFLYQLFHLRVFVGTIYSLVSKDLKFDWSIQVTRKRRAVGKSHSFGQMIYLSILAGTATWKQTSTPAVIISYRCRGRWFVFAKKVLNVLFWDINYSYFQKFFKVGVLKNYAAQLTGKHLCWTLFLIS